MAIMPMCIVALHNFLLVDLIFPQTGDQDNDYLNYHRNFRRRDWKRVREGEKVRSSLFLHCG